MDRKSAIIANGVFVATCALMAAAPLRAAEGEILVESFEDSSAKITTENATVKIISAKGVTHGKKALQIVLDDADDDVIHIAFANPVDASELGDVNIAMDVTNNSKVSVHLFVGVQTGNGHGQLSSTVIAPGETQTLYKVLTGFEASVETGLREIPPGWETTEDKLIERNRSGMIDVSQITQVTLQTSANPSVREILIDNIRVRTNPVSDPFFLTEIVDRFGQAAKEDFPYKVRDEEHLLEVTRKELADLAASDGPPGRSKWGGWANGPKLKGTGYFRTEKVNGKWWMVDPDGHLFWSNGIANIRMANLGTQTGYDFSDPEVRIIDPEELTPEDSLDIVTLEKKYWKSRYLASPIRRELFQWLPTYDHPLGDHYGYRRTFHKGAQDSGEIYSFYKANLERKYGDDYLMKWRDTTIDRMKVWGFPSLGNWVDPIYYQADRIPYFANGWIIGNFKTVSSGNDYWSPLPDVYDPNFKRRARLTIEQIAREVQGSPWCIGVFVDNEKSWGRGDDARGRYGLVLDALSKDIKDSPAKAQFSGMAKERYGNDIAALNAAWGTSFADWAEFDASAVPADPEAIREDLAEMMLDYGETYFRIVSEELDRVLPNHMYMGVRMAQWGMPPEIVQAAVKYSDVLSFNNYKETMHPDRWAFLSELDRPTLIGEFHMGATSDTGFPHPGLIHATDQTDRARMYEQYINSVLDNDYMVGAHWFQYVDDVISGRSYDGENYNVGWVTNTDLPYGPMIESAKRVNYGLYRRRFED